MDEVDASQLYAGREELLPGHAHREVQIALGERARHRGGAHVVDLGAGEALEDAVAVLGGGVVGGVAHLRLFDEAHAAHRERA